MWEWRLGLETKKEKRIEGEVKEEDAKETKIWSQKSNNGRKNAQASTIKTENIRWVGSSSKEIASEREGDSF